MPFDAPNVFTSDDVLSMHSLPERLVVVGAGVIGCEYASIFASLDVAVELIDINDTALPFLDGEINQRLIAGLRERGVELHLGVTVEAASAESGRVSVTTTDGRAFTGDALLVSAGRIANTDNLGCEIAGVELGRKGRPVVNGSFQTSAPDIYAVGDVLGFPALASTAMEQGRVAAAHAFAADLTSRLDVMPADACAPYPLIPIGIYTVPSASMVGQTSEQVAESGRPYVVGRAPYSTRDRGLLIGDPNGMLKAGGRQRAPRGARRSRGRRAGRGADSHRSGPACTSAERSSTSCGRCLTSRPWRACTSEPRTTRSASFDVTQLAWPAREKASNLEGYV